MISDVNAYKDYLMMVNATPVLVRMVRESQMDVLFYHGVLLFFATFLSF